ncbi:DUF3578 domain-containing protein [Polaribacter sp. Z022]|uniref:MrcB family domain-containing protein n=1 Tax=Polaribacter sp. Z022 TaxID=2927125 RepID=UPI002021FB86|nr:DUF3578 domain-containing protein [Polaribacter sp. Z022]MCL7754935.1 DUF3578 domain-containing protein [Polaribacter sp. Z022]
MIPNNITKIHIEKAINEIEENGITKGRNSSTYDVIFNGKRYPPKLIISLANKYANGIELDSHLFAGGEDTHAFRLLKKEGFKIIKKTDIIDKKFQSRPNITEFIKVSNEQETGKGTKSTATQYKRNNKGKLDDLKIEISFGVGRASSIPWIAFTSFNQTVKDGIYPVFLYYKEHKTLILAYGISETNEPQHSWSHTNSKKTIKEYFKTKLSISNIKYGTSFVYKTYDIESLPSEEVLNKELKKLINEYIVLFSDKTDKGLITKEIKQKDFNLSSFINTYNESGLNYSSELITRYISSLVTKPFVLLSGLSGSGKTKLSQAFAQWIAEDKNQYCIIPVGADWTNREPLLGYVNALDNTEYILPENGALKLLIEANKEENKNKPYFLILDEMNLSHVERYFADFLSVMESKDIIKLHSSTNNKGIVPPNINWPKNLFIIGTVNIDETTYMFSPKVLDRANVIEFRVNKEDISNFLEAPKEIDFTNLDTKGASMGEHFVSIAANKTFPEIDTKVLNEKLVLFFEELKKTGAEFGYRTATEIHRLYNQLTTLDNNMPENTKIDIAIMQKLLPKLHGSRRKLCPVLETLASLCVSTGVNASKTFLNNRETIVYNNNDNILYPLSLEKITRMYKGAIDNGFASYAEA